MNSLNLSLAVTGAFADVISPRYENPQAGGDDVENRFHGKFHIIPKDRPIILLVMCVSCALGGRKSEVFSWLLTKRPEISFKHSLGPSGS